MENKELIYDNGIKQEYSSNYDGINKSGGKQILIQL